MVEGPAVSGWGESGFFVARESRATIQVGLSPPSWLCPARYGFLQERIGIRSTVSGCSPDCKVVPYKFALKLILIRPAGCRVGRSGALPTNLGGHKVPTLHRSCILFLFERDMVSEISQPNRGGGLCKARKS